MKLNQSFPISNTTKHCFTPFTCATANSHLVAWLQGDKKGVSYLMLNNSLSIDNPPQQLAILLEQDEILFFREYCDSQYVLVIDHNPGYSLYILDNEGAVVSKCLIDTKLFLVHCSGYTLPENKVQLFLYNYDSNIFTVSTIELDEDQAPVVQNTHHDVGGIPHVITYNDGSYVAGWLDNENCLVIVTFWSTTGSFETKTISNYIVDCLLAVQINDDCVVFGGYDSPTQKLRLDYCHFRHNIITVDSRYFKSTDYSSKYHYNLFQLPEGFMLIAEGPQNTSLYGQQFTLEGGVTSPMKELMSNSWGGCVSYTGNNTLLVYTRDTSSASEIWGKHI